MPCRIDLQITLLLLIIGTIRSERWFTLTPEFTTIPMLNGEPAEVQLQLEFNQLLAMAANMEAELSYFLNVRWFDHRFVRNGSTNPDHNFVSIYGSELGWEMIWRPDIYMTNEIPSGIFDMVPTDFIRIYENGTLTMSTRHMILFYCKIRLFKLPMTAETCNIQFQSNSYSTDEMDLSWFEGKPIIYSADFISLVSRITGTVTTECIGQSVSEFEQRPCLMLALHIDQVYKGFIIQVYLPSTAIIFMAWLAFFIHIKEVSGRVRVVSMTFTAMVTQMVGVMIVFPDTVQLEPLLIWNGFCLGMNLLAFIEFIIAHNMYVAYELRKKQKQELDVEAPKVPADENHNKKSGVKRIQVEPYEQASSSTRNFKKKSRTCWKLTPFRLDRICMVIYLVVVFVFNVIYWTTFMVTPPPPN